MFPATSAYYTQIAQKRPAIKKKETGWTGKLFENLRIIRNILDALYEYVYNASEPSVKNLDALLKELNEVRTILREDVVLLDRNLREEELRLMPLEWKAFVKMVQSDIEINDYLALQEALRLYIQLEKAKPKVLNTKNIAALKKELVALESQRKDFLKTFWRFKEKFSRYVDMMPN